MAVRLRTVFTVDTTDVARKMRRMRRLGASLNRGLIRPVGRAVSNTIRLAAVVAGVAATGIAMAARAAGAFEALRVRLETVMGSAQKANRAFKETFSLFVRSPMELEPLIEARVLLESLGVAGPAALKSVANAAAIMGRDVRKVAMAVGSMRATTLRRLGIDKSQKGDTFTFEFINKMGQVVKVAAEGRRQAQKELLKIFDIKFGGGLDKMAKTWKGAWSTFTGASKAAAGEIGTGVKNRITDALIEINKWLIRALETGRFKKISAELGEFAATLINGARRVIRAWNTLGQAQREQLQGMLTGAGAFIVAWKTGWLQPIVMGLTLLVATQAWAFAAVAAGLVGLGAFFVAFKIGRALERSFEFSTLILKTGFALRAALNIWLGYGKAVMGMYIDLFSNIKRAMSGGETDFADAIGRRLRMFAKTAKAELKTLKVGVAATIEVSEGAEERDFKQKARALRQRLREEFSKTGLAQDIESFLPDAIRQFMAKLTQDIPDLPKQAKSDDLAGDMNAAADDAERMAKAVVPLRGFRGSFEFQGRRPVAFGAPRLAPQRAGAFAPGRQMLEEIRRRAIRPRALLAAGDGSQPATRPNATPPTLAAPPMAPAAPVAALNSTLAAVVAPITRQQQIMATVAENTGTAVGELKKINRKLASGGSLSFAT